MLKLVLGVLIVFGIATYRTLLMQSLQYALTLNLNALLCILFILISIIINSFRFRYLIKIQGGLIKFRDVFVSYFLSFSTVFSLVKLADSVKIVYLKKKGLLLSQATTAYIAERIANVFVTSILIGLILGQYNFWLLIGAGLSILLIIIFINFSHMLPKIRFVNMVRDFGSELKKLMKFKSIIIIVLFTLFEFLSSALAIGFATHTNFGLSIKTTVMGMATVIATPTPGGIGFYETVIPTFLTQQGVVVETAVGGILTYRFFSLWLPALIGLILLQKTL